MARVQLALNVSNLDSAIDFYTTLFDTPPAKVRPGYANFAVADPPLKLVLIENPGASEALNHLGIEVDDPGAVVTAQRRLTERHLETSPENHVSCCYAVQDKVWVDTPDGWPWEIYAVLGDVEMPDDTTPSAPCCT